MKIFDRICQGFMKPNYTPIVIVNRVDDDGLWQLIHEFSGDMTVMIPVVDKGSVLYQVAIREKA